MSERVKITAHRETDGQCFCWFKNDAPALEEHIDEIEAAFYKQDDEQRVTDSLTPEGERDSPAPVVGEVLHDNGTIVAYDFDLSRWYE